jgi:hypothetical protein
MGQLRRAPLACVILACAFALCFQSCQWPEAASSSRGLMLVIANGKLPGGFRVTNKGEIPLSLDREVTVEIWDKAKWNEIKGIVKLIDGCNPQPKGCLRLMPGSSFGPLSWTGMSCGAQCGEACRANEYYGPGKFRYVLKDCDGKERWTGPEFELPKVPTDAYKN